MKDEIKFLSISEVSKLLNINKATLYRMAKIGKLNFKKIGKLWRINSDDITNIFSQEKKGG